LTKLPQKMHRRLTKMPDSRTVLLMKGEYPFPLDQDQKHGCLQGS
jgi:hypothetical protein